MNFLDHLNHSLSVISAKERENGKRIYFTRGNQIALIDADIEEGGFLLLVPGNGSSFEYEVKIWLSDEYEPGIGCECAYYEANLECKHEAAALYWLQEYLSGGNFLGVEKASAVPRLPARDSEGYYSFSMARMNMHVVASLCNSPEGYLGRKLNNLIAIDDKNPHFKFHFKEKTNLFEIDIIYNRKDNYRTRCSCGDRQSPLCQHVATAFWHLDKKYGYNFDLQFKDFTEVKNKLLAQYGLTVDDPDAKHFEFGVDYGNIVLKRKPDFILPKGSVEFFMEMKRSIAGGKTETGIIRPKLPATEIIDYEVGFLLNFTSKKPLGLELEPVFVRDKKGKPDVKKLALHKESNWAYLQPLSGELFEKMIAFTDQKLVQKLAESGYTYLKSYANPWTVASPDVIAKLRSHYFGLLADIWNDLLSWPHVFVLREGNFSKVNINPAKVSNERVELVFKVEADKFFVTVSVGVKIKEKAPAAGSIVTLLRSMIFDVDGVFHLPANEADLAILRKFGRGMLKFPVADRKDVIRNVIEPLLEKYEVNFSDSFNYEIIEPDPEPRVLLKEFNNQFLMLKPQFVYDDAVVDYDEEQEHLQDTGPGVRLIRRNKAEEAKLYEFMRTLHPKFSNQRNNQYYHLLFDEVLKNNWFFNMIQQVQEAGFPVYGLQELKKFKYNVNRPKIDIKAGSGIDWFDLQIVAQWGDQEVSLKQLRNAILNGQEAILLGDGTLGQVPSDWLKQYGPLLKMGAENNNSLRISKLHYALLEDIDGTLDSPEVKEEITRKKKLLHNFNNLKKGSVPKSIGATLRPYQEAGFQWMQALEMLGWGGCLADDMGLGKTLQTITFLSSLKERHPKSTHLVICPTSLIYNWESELQKFCPSLKYHIYYGVQRSFNDTHFEEYNVVLTSYGLARNDLEQLQQFDWHYLVLDESQAIKNPEALVTKAVQLLKAKNRLILSGTPVQNNTYDLYAQFTFLNPGLLGNREFFKREFATPIDKQGDKEKAEQLRRLVYPFMLRRTKEQVATDLPDKTEMVLWCTLGKEQRSLYDEYKNYYRAALLKKIEDEGINKAGIYVLEGLLRLRQICDHPALLKADDVKVSESAKMEELLREIKENTGHHKLLVFSQFTEMLQLLKKALEGEGISYTYLDGSTPAGKRKQLVNDFQDDPVVKVFLVSLKAGGVGLNLTAADYVYLVDPWWNPAVEQQAIDRTHRIGQTKKIFAYKMICKDTVEEKIMQLQQKKKTLAEDLISEEAGFVKKLTKDDVEFLFS